MDRHWLALGLVVLLAPPFPAAAPVAPAGGPLEPAGDPISVQALPALPVQGFIRNDGQLPDGSIRYYTRGPLPAAFTDTGVRFLVRGPDGTACCAMRFSGARPSSPIGLGPFPGTSSFLLGNDPSGWRTGVPAFGELLYRGLYPGIDLRFLASGRGLKYEFEVAPGADPSAIALEYEGAVPSVEGLTVLLGTPAGTLADGELAVYQPSGSGRTPVEAAPVASGLRVSFDLGAYDRSRPLVIDPLLCCTVTGGSGDDYAIAMTVDRFDNAYVTGETLSPDFPATPNNWSGGPLGGGSTFDLFVVKLGPDGRRTLFSTYIGSAANDFAHDIRVDGSGFVYVTGYTYGFDFPVTDGSFDTSYNGCGDVFVLKLSPAGTTLLFSTFAGGDDVDFGYALALSEDGSVLVAGGTRSCDFPVTPGALQTSIRTGTSEEDAFVLRLEGSGSSLGYCTYLGGGGQDHVLALAVDPEGRATVAGSTTSPDLPVSPGAAGPALRNTDAFVARLDPEGSSLDFCTFLGGSGVDSACALLLDGTGGCLVAGDTTSLDFPGAFFGAGGIHKGRRDCFVAHIAENGTQVACSTLFGGSGDDSASGLETDAGGNISLAGTTSSADLPVTAAADCRANRGRTDAFIARFDPECRDLMYAGYFGGSLNDSCAGMATGASGELVLAGTTDSPDLPGAPDGTVSSKGTFLARLAPVCVPGTPALALVAGSRAVSLNLTPPRLGAGSLTGYTVYRGEAPDALKPLCGLQEGQRDYEDSGLENGVMYHYAVSARNASGEGERSAVRKAMPGLPPSAPRDLEALASSSLVRLSWRPPRDLFDLPVLKYRVYRSRAGSSTFLLAEVTARTEYDDRNVQNDFVHCYQVSAVNLIGESARSGEARATPSERPSAPENITVRADGRNATLSWDRPANQGASPITNYTVYLELEDGRLRLLGTTPVCQYVDRDLPAGRYSYRLRANSVLYEGYLSGPVSVDVYNLPPVAGFTVDRLEGTSGTPFAFTSTSFDRDTVIVNYTWRFGDGTVSHKQDPVHYYARRGLYNLSLRVRDADGAEAIQTGMVQVQNTPPAIVGSSPGGSAIVYRGASREFSITPLDPDQDTLLVSWYVNGSLSGTGNTTRITFDRLGQFVLVAELGDGEAVARAYWNITVVPAPPEQAHPQSYWLAGAVLAAAVAASGAALFRRRAARRRSAPEGPGGRVHAGKAGGSGEGDRPVKGASQKHIIRKRYS